MVAAFLRDLEPQVVEFGRLVAQHDRPLRGRRVLGGIRAVVHLVTDPFVHLAGDLIDVQRGSGAVGWSGGALAAGLACGRCRARLASRCRGEGFAAWPAAAMPAAAVGSAAAAPAGGCVSASSAGGAAIPGPGGATGPGGAAALWPGSGASYRRGSGPCPGGPPRNRAAGCAGGGDPAGAGCPAAGRARCPGQIPDRASGRTRWRRHHQSCGNVRAIRPGSAHDRF